MQPTEEDLLLLAKEQLTLSSELITDDTGIELELIAGVDVAYRGTVAYSAAVVLDKEMELIQSSKAQTIVQFPYISGYLSYRELEPALRAVKQLKDYDVLMVNGHGLAHPRGFGLASHLGIQLDKPTLGVAKRLMVGEPLDSEAKETLIVYKNKIIGAKLQSPLYAPVYVSIGHLLSLDTCIQVVKEYTTEGRLPEPLRLAHQIARSLMDES